MPYKDPEKLRAYQAKYQLVYRRDGRQKECTRRYRRTLKGMATTWRINQRPERQEYLRIYSARQRAVHRDRVKARRILNHAIRDGKIARLPCGVCGGLKTEAHHSDYSKPLDVRWLCENHHTELHRREYAVAHGQTI